MIPLHMLAAGAALSIATGFAGGWTVRDWKADRDTLSAADAAYRQIDAARGRIDAQGERFELFRQLIEPRREQDRTTIKEVYRNVEVVADCALRPDALGVLNAALERANAATTSQSGEPVPDAASAGSGDRP